MRWRSKRSAGASSVWELGGYQAASASRRSTGKVKLDLSQAQFESDRVEIDLQLTYGQALIIVPRSAVVDLDGLVADWKQPSYRGPREGPGSRPLVRIIGHMEYGRLKVRHR